MDALRARFAAVAEWLVAGVFLAASVAVGALILGELRTVGAFRAKPVATLLPVSIPSSVPPGAVSVPELPLIDGNVLKIGEALSAVSTRLGRAAESGMQEIDRGSLGERLTRHYEYGGARFILVFEPFERRGEARLAAIYLREKPDR